MKNKKLNVLLAKKTVMVAIVLGFLTSIVSIVFDLRGELNRSRSDIDQAISVVTFQVRQALLEQDENLARQTVNDLLAYRAIYKAELEDDLGNLLAESERRPVQSFNDSLTLGVIQQFEERTSSIYNGAGTHLIGQLKISIDLLATTEGFANRLLTTLFIGVARNVIFVLILMKLFSYILTKPIGKIIENSRDIDLSDRPIRLLQTPAGHTDDDLGELVRAFNHLVSGYQHNEVQLRRKQKMDALIALTRGITHDYNNKLNIITGYAELLNEELVDIPQLADYSQSILHAGREGAVVSKKLLSFTRSISGNTGLTNINQILQAEREVLEKMLAPRVQLCFDLDNDLWSTWLDIVDLKEAIFNMSINAVHSIEGHGELTMQTSNEHVTNGEAKRLNLEPGDYVLLKITDTGCGIDFASQERIFDPFYSTKGEPGTGLGLSQVYGFLKRSQAAIDVCSEVDCGTSLMVYFPRYIADSEGDECTKSVSISNLEGDETILVVDDELELLTLTVHSLKKYGYRVICTESGNQALSVLVAEPVDLLITDVIMPKMNGHQLAAFVKKAYPATRIQLVSGFDTGLYAGTVDKNLQENLLFKPIDTKVLLHRIRKLLDEKYDNDRSNVS